MENSGAPPYFTLPALKRLMNAAKDHQNVYSKTWDQNLLAYRGIDPDRRAKADYNGYPTIRIKYAFQILEVIRVNIVEPRPTFDFEADIPEYQRAAEALDILIPKQLNVDRFAHKQNIWVEDDFVCGINVGKVAWRRQTDWQGEIVEDRPTQIPVDPRLFYGDPNAQSQEDWGYVVEEAHLTEAQLNSAAALGYYDAAGVRDTLRSAPNRMSDDPGVDRTYKVYELWTRDFCQTFSDNAILAEYENDVLPGRIPYFVGSTIDRPRCIYGIPEVELVDDPQLQLWALDNMGMEALQFQSRPIMGYRRERIGTQELQSNFRPGGAVPFGTPQDISVVWQGGDPSAIFQRKTEALADMQNVTGASAYLSGSDSAQYGVNQSTATGMSIIEAGASKRMKHRMMNLEEFYSNMVSAQISLNATYLNGAIRLRTRDGHGYKEVDFDPSDLYGVNMCVTPRWLAQGTNEEANIQSLQAMFNTLAPLALQGYRFPDGSQINLRPLVEEMVSARRWDPNRYFSNTPESNNPLTALQVGPSINGGAPIPAPVS